MKTTLLLSFLLFSIASLLPAQGINYSYDSKELKGLATGTLYIIPTGDKTFDDSLISAISKYWTICPYKVLAPDEVNAAIKNQYGYFIAPTAHKDNKVVFASPAECSKYAAIQLFHGDAYIESRFSADIITGCAYPFSNAKFSLYGLPYIIKNINDNINFVIKNKINPTKTTTHAELPINAQFSVAAPEIKSRILLIPDTFSNGQFPPVSFKNYKYKYRYTSEHEIVRLTSTRPEQYCFVPEYCHEKIEVYDPATKSKIYCGQSGSNGIVSGDLVEAFNDAIDGIGTK
jgi:hypothetical protein